MKRRSIAESLVNAVLADPEQVQPQRPGRVVFQSRFELGTPSRQYLVRVFVDIDRVPSEVVTVYRTSNIQKYWAQS